MQYSFWLSLSLCLRCDAPVWPVILFHDADGRASFLHSDWKSGKGWEWELGLAGTLHAVLKIPLLFLALELRISIGACWRVSLPIGPPGTAWMVSEVVRVGLR